MNSVVSLRNNVLKSQDPNLSYDKAYEGLSSSNHNLVVVGTETDSNGDVYNLLAERPPPPTGQYHVNEGDDAMRFKQGYDASVEPLHKREVKAFGDTQPEPTRFVTGMAGRGVVNDDRVARQRAREVAAVSTYHTRDMGPNAELERPAHYQGYVNVSDYSSITRPVPQTKRNTTNKVIDLRARHVDHDNQGAPRHPKVFLPGLEAKNNFALPAPTASRSSSVSGEIVRADVRPANSRQLESLRPSKRGSMSGVPTRTNIKGFRPSSKRALAATPITGDSLAVSGNGSNRTLEGAHAPVRRKTNKADVQGANDGPTRRAFSVDALALPKRHTLVSAQLKTDRHDTRVATHGKAGRVAKDKNRPRPVFNGNDESKGSYAQDLPQMTQHEDSRAATMLSGSFATDQKADVDMSFREKSTSIHEGTPLAATGMADTGIASSARDITSYQSSRNERFSGLEKVERI